jgi:hypothetical protein
MRDCSLDGHPGIGNDARLKAGGAVTPFVASRAVGVFMRSILDPSNEEWAKPTITFKNCCVKTFFRGVLKVTAGDPHLLT